LNKIEQNKGTKPNTQNDIDHSIMIPILIPMMILNSLILGFVSTMFISRTIEILRAAAEAEAAEVAVAEAEVAVAAILMMMLNSLILVALHFLVGAFS
jgi:hypothetical protein